MAVTGTIYDETVLHGTAKLLNAQTAANSASLIYTTGLQASNGFDVFFFEIDNVFLAGGPLAFQVSTDGGASWYTTSYWQVAVSVFTNYPTYVCYQSNTSASWQTQLVLGHGAADVGHPSCGYIKLFNPPSGFKHIIWGASNYHTTYASYFHMGGGHISNSNLPRITGIKFFNYTAGNLVSGSIRMWGMRQL